ncbi:hypothetical protein ABT324_23945 [Saccharopolyspora sp. NPDC000359]|uniref:hypothetical protein n=1 Tax=Saccharopolyspora sp. NPDC000359 TaxID=3154251 RepID=UPI00331AF8AD
MGQGVPHPIERLHAARDEIDNAATRQSRVDLAKEDWPAYGSALLGVLYSLEHLTSTLVEQIDRVDREELFERALRDHPHEALDRAVGHLRHMNDVLASAVSDARGYWAESRHAHEDTVQRHDEPES